MIFLYYLILIHEIYSSKIQNGQTKGCFDFKIFLSLILKVKIRDSKFTFRILWRLTRLLAFYDKSNDVTAAPRVLTMSSVASLAAVTDSTRTSGTTVVNQDSEDI